MKTLLHLLTAILTTVPLTTCPRSKATRRTLSGSNQQLNCFDVGTGTTQPFREWERPPKNHFTLPGLSRRSRRWVVEATDSSWQPGRNRRCNEGTMWSQWRLRGSENVYSDVGPLSSLSHFLAVLSRQRQVSASNWRNPFAATIRYGLVRRWQRRSVHAFIV